MSIQNFLLKKYLRIFYKPRLNQDTTLEEARTELDQLIEHHIPLSSRNVDIWQETIGGVVCECMQPKRKAAKGTLFYIHGGLFAMGSPLSHRGATLVLAERLGLRLIIPDYRLAPEHPFPAGLEDITAAYLACVEAYADEALYLAGDQAGACLAFQLSHTLSEQDYTQPDALVGISGLYDLSLASESLESNADAECLMTMDVFTRGLDYYLGDAYDRASPEVSPLYQNHEQGPPVFLQVSNIEMLFDDSRRMASVLEDAGRSVKLKIYSDVPHCWHLGATALPEGKRAIDDIGRFFKNLSR